MTSNKRKMPKWLGVILALIIIVGGYFGWRYYEAFFGASVTDKQEYLYIRDGDNYEKVLRTITEKGMVDNPDLFDVAAGKMDYKNNVKPGRYKLTPGMNNRRLIGNLRGGYQEAVKFRFETVRLKENFAALLGKNFEADSTVFISLLNDPTTAEKYGFTQDNFFSMFIPNTYEIYWNTAPEKMFARFHDEYNKFWNEDRMAKARAINLTRQEVSVLASIVKGEALHKNEMPTIAGLYINRLKKGMLLQADPTVIFATKDFTIRRVLNKHLRTESPYNTYLNKGLPPGPISLPTIASIDAVLNYEHHDFIYMVAKEDFSGYHNFSRTESEHLAYARKYQQKLNERNIKK